MRKLIPKLWTRDIMKTLITLVAALFLTASLSACSHITTNQDIGLVAGGVAGGLAGHALTGGSTAGTIAGAVGGGYVGSQLAQ